MNTYKIVKNDKVIAKRRAENAMEAMKKWAEFLPFGNDNPAAYAKLKMFDASSRGKQWATFTDGYTVLSC